MSGRRVLAGLAIVVVLLARAGGAEADPIELSLKSQLESERRSRAFPGATAAIVLANGHVARAAVGFGDVELQLPMRTGSRMPAGSIGKTFVAALTLALVAEDRLTLDDKLSKWLSGEDWFYRLSNGDAVRIRNLLNHSAGINEHLQSRRFGELMKQRMSDQPGVPMEPRQLIGFVLDEPAPFSVGEGFKYTDTGYILLQLALEKAGGIQLGEEIFRRFIYPLQLESTSPAAGQVHPGVVQGYVNVESFPGLPSTALDRGIFRWNPVSEWAGGGFISSSADLARWAQALYGGRALPPGMAQMMVSAPNLNEAPEGYEYGLGTVVTHSDYGREWGHNGVYPGYRSSMKFFPDCGFALAFQVNTDRVTALDISEMGRALAAAVRPAGVCTKAGTPEQ